MTPPFANNIDTPRLILTNDSTPADLPFLFDLLKGMLGLSDAKSQSQSYNTDTVVEFLREKEKKSKEAQPHGPGYAHYIVRLRQEGNDDSPGIAIGSVAVFCRQADMPTELAYGLLGPYHGKGYGTEAVSAVLRHLRQDLGVEQVCALIRPTNVRSRRLAGKLGLEENGSIKMLGQPGLSSGGIAEYSVFLLPHMERVTADTTWY